MKNTVTLLFVSLMNYYTAAQAPSIQWQKTLGGTAEEKSNCILPTADGGSIVAGYTLSADGDVSSNQGIEDYWIVKLTSMGTVQWQKTLGGTDTDIATSIIQTTDGGYVVAGYTLSNDGDVTGNHGGYDYWVVKLNSSGVIQWQKTYGGTDNDLAYSLLQTTDGGLLVAGITTSYDGNVTVNHGNGDAWLVKLNSTGTIQWQKSVGGSDYDLAAMVIQTTDGSIVFAGKTSSNTIDVSGNHGSFDYWVVKLNSTGTLQWQATLGGTSVDEANSIIQTTDGGFIVSGIISSNNGNITGFHGNFDYWVVKLNATGVLQWQKSLGGTDHDRGFGVVQTVDGGCIVAGCSDSYNGDLDLTNDTIGNYWLVKLDSLGIIQWKKSMGGSDFDSASCIAKTSNGGFLIAGQTDSNDGDVTGYHGGTDIWIVKLNPETLGTTVFIKSDIVLYPNPVVDVLHIHNLNEPIISIRIIDLLGKIVVQQLTIQTVNVALLPKGTYILEINTVKGKYFSKFVKE